MLFFQQIYLRWQRGQTQDPRFATFGNHIRTLINHATRLTNTPEP